ncbi:MAG: hypothetical protein HKP32_12225 [Woeseia sp.]|nr:hypothetical protein [Woeseia sp.]
MRTLNENELCMVAGGTGTCTPTNLSGNNIGGVTNSSSLGQDLINVYEGFVHAASHIMERVALAF